MRCTTACGSARLRCGSRTRRSTSSSSSVRSTILPAASTCKSTARSIRSVSRPKACSTARPARVQQALTKFHGSIEELLGEAFDPDSKKSVVSTIETLVAQVVQKAVDGVREIVEPQGDESPLARLKGEILVGVKGEIDGVVQEIRDVSERLGIATAVAEEHERTSAKGFDFEDRRRRVASPRSPPSTATRTNRSATNGRHGVEGRRRSRHVEPDRHRRPGRPLRPRGEEAQARHAQDPRRARRGDAQPRSAGRDRRVRLAGERADRGAVPLHRRHRDRRPRRRGYRRRGAPPRVHVGPLDRSPQTDERHRRNDRPRAGACPDRGRPAAPSNG